MKGIYFFIVLLSAVPVFLVHAQGRDHQDKEKKEKQRHKKYPPTIKTEHGQYKKKVVVNFLELAKLPDTLKIKKESDDEENEKLPHNLPPPAGIIHYDTISGAKHGVIPANSPGVQSPAPSNNFIALVDNITAIPPDVGGAVGLNYLMVTLNSQVSIMSKAGAFISTVSLNNFWSSLSITNAYDPKVLYDPYANRWIMVSAAGAESKSSIVLIAVSQTSDPTGNWNQYQLTSDAAGKDWFDYPSVGFNKNWIVVNGNMYGITSGNFDYTKVFMFNKSTLYAGGTDSYTTYVNSTIGGTIVPATTYDSTLDTLYLLQSWNGSIGDIRLYSVTGAVGAEVFAAVSLINTTTTWAYEGATTWDFAPQLNSSNLLSSNDDRMQHLVYRNGNLYACHTIFLPEAAPTRSSVQWWELTKAGAVVQHGYVDDNTGKRFYAFPSIGVNSQNEVLIGYASFSATQYPSADYSYQSPCDAASTLESDYIFKAGEASYFKTYAGATNRWGDYTSVYVDPANDVDLWTLQEYSTTPGSGYDRWSTWWAQVTPTVFGGAGTFTWTGATSTDWFNPCNWDKNALPDIHSDVVIPGGTANNPVISGNTASCNTITINSTNGAKLTVNSTARGFINIAQ